MEQVPKRILVIKLKHIGDVLLATPAIHALKEAFPESRIYALVREGTEAMLTLNPDLEEVLAFEKVKDLKQRFETEWRLLRRVRGIRPDVVIEMGNGDREAILGFLSGAKIRVGYDPRGSGFLGRRCFLTHLVPQDWKKHVVESNLDLVRALGIEPTEKHLRLFVSRADEEVIDGLLREKGVTQDDTLITIHPTSRWLFKCWTDEGFARVAGHLVAHHRAKVAVTSGPEKREVEKAKRVIELARSPLIALLGCLTLKQLAALIARSTLFLGVDSAPMHIASAVKTPVVALFGPSGEQTWGPWGEGHLVVKKDLPCRPCGRDGCNGSKRSDCLEAISFEEVMTAVEKQLSSRAVPSEVGESD